MNPAETIIVSMLSANFAQSDSSMPCVRDSKAKAAYLDILTTPMATLAGNVSDRPDAISAAILGYN